MPLAGALGARKTGAFGGEGILLVVESASRNGLCGTIRPQIDKDGVFGDLGTFE